MPAVTIINLEEGRPTGDEACRRMRFSLRMARGKKLCAVKLIHGYGSTGQGGTIRSRVRRELLEMKKRGELREFVPGEAFSPFEQSARSAIDFCPELARDRDYNRCNPGITVVVL